MDSEVKRKRNCNDKPKMPETALEHFAAILVQIVDSGLPACQEWGIWPSPYFVLLDNEGNRWPQQPWEMGREDILRYARTCWPRFATDAARAPQLTVH